jgi:peptide/nickel transport system permease protein
MSVLGGYTETGDTDAVGPLLMPAPGEGITGARALRRMARAVRSNGKATAGAVLLVIFILVALFPGVIAHDNPNAEIYPRSLGPSLRHLLGTTSFGQDIYAQVVWGARPVLLIAFGVGIGATLIAMLVGVAAAYLGGAWDGSLSLVTDVLLVIPLFPLLIIIGSYLHGVGTLVMIVVITATGWSFTARQLRSQALSLRNRDFLQAARVRGERSLYIIVVEIIPTMTSLLVASFLTNALYAVLFSSSLQFIGLGNPAVTSWGTMLYWAEQEEAFQIGLPLWIIAPGLCIVALGAAFALLNYAFDEIGNPALRSARSMRGKRVKPTA